MKKIATDAVENTSFNSIMGEYYNMLEQQRMMRGVTPHIKRWFKFQEALMELYSHNIEIPKEDELRVRRSMEEDIVFVFNATKGRFKGRL